MVKFKKVLAIFTAAALVITPMTAFAADGDKEQTATGQGTVENDNSAAPSYDKVVLPTVDDSTFNFTLDPDKLLHEYDPDKYTDANATLLFQSVSTPATIEIREGDKKAYKKTYTEETNTDGLKNKVTYASGAYAVGSSDFYIWTPDTTTGNEGMGKYTLVDASNLETYFEVTKNDSNAVTAVDFKNPKLAASACDGKLYKLGYEALGAASAAVEATDYVTADTDGTVTAITDLYVSADGTAYTALAASDSSKYEYTAAEVTYNANTDSVKIVNKSTKAMDVKAVITVKNATGLSFSTTNDFSGTGDDEKLVYLAVTDGTTPAVVATVNKDGNATITGEYALAAPSATALKYQTSDVDPLTGSHVYKQYMPQNLSYNSVELKVTGAANAGASDAWNEYADTLRDYVKPDGSDVANVRPTLEVVFTIAEHVDRYIAETTVSAAANALTLNLPSGVTLSKVQSVKADTVTDLTTEWYTLSGNTLTINTTIINNTKNLKIKVTFSDSRTEEVTIDRS